MLFLVRNVSHAKCLPFFFSPPPNLQVWIFIDIDHLCPNLGLARVGLESIRYRHPCARQSGELCLTESPSPCHMWVIYHSSCCFSTFRWKHATHNGRYSRIMAIRDYSSVAHQKIKHGRHGENRWVLKVNNAQQLMWALLTCTVVILYCETFRRDSRGSHKTWAACIC